MVTLSVTIKQMVFSCLVRTFSHTGWLVQLIEGEPISRGNMSENALNKKRETADQLRKVENLGGIEICCHSSACTISNRLRLRLCK